MSYHRNYGGGHRRRYRDDDRDERPVETPEQRLRAQLIKFADVDPAQEVPKLGKQIAGQSPSLVPTTSEGLRIGLTEQPYKIPYYAALFRVICETTDENGIGGVIGKQIFDDFWRGFQAYLDKQSWREVRVCLHFFAHLTMAEVVSPQSMLALLQSFAAVLEELGASYTRAKNAALCTVEGLMRAGPVLKAHSPADVSALVNSIQSFVEVASSNRPLVSPIARPTLSDVKTDTADDVLDICVAVAQALDASGFIETASSFPQPYASLPAFDSTSFTAFDIPMMLVPPEIIELDALTNAEEVSDASPPQKKDEWPEYTLRLFDSGVTADPKTPAGYVVKSLISDVVDIFEVNRKECARLLLDIPKWCLHGTFKARQGVTSGDEEQAEGPEWQLESCIFEVILSKMFVLPESKDKPMYYAALITELCKVSPSTVGPAVGKSIRKMYSLLAEGLDVEIARRFVDWFTVHMSNFGFQWVWKEWIPDLSLQSHHPKRNFIRRAIEIEIRLAYYDRVLKTLPEPFQAPDAETVPDQAPGPDFEYDDPMRPHHDAAQSILNLLRGRSKADEVVAHVETLKGTLAETVEGDVNVDSLIRSMAVQSLLHIGARSFSHFLNAVERYLPVLRSIASSSDGKIDILLGVVDFWKRNRQMIVIIFDKLMQYQVVDPSDIVTWAFSPATPGAPAVLDTFKWELVRGALDKANGRVAISKRKVTALRKEEDDNRARAKASGGDTTNMGTMEVDVLAEEKTVDSPALITAIKANASLIKEQKAVLSRVLEEFVNALSQTGSVLDEASWANRADWSNSEWDAWETYGWYRNFCRVYAPYLKNYAVSLSTISFTKLDTSAGVGALIKGTWDMALGQES